MDPDTVAAAALDGLRRGRRIVVPDALGRLHHLVARLVPAALISRLFARRTREDPRASTLN